MVLCTINPSTQEAEAGGSLWVLGQPVLCIEVQAIQGYNVRSFLKQTNKNVKRNGKDKRKKTR